MSRLLIDRYYADLADCKQYGGQLNESNLRKSFANLLDGYCRPRNYRLVEEIATRTTRGNIIKFDGVVKNALRFDLGYWEAKDTKDDLDREIAAKFEKGYPDDNILFENTETAVLIQSGEEAFRIELADAAALDRCLNQFLDYERPEVKGFRQAIEKFREDLPQIVEVLRETIAQEETSNQRFLELRDRFWETCKTSINPQITLFDVQEILIQHILSEDIFLNVFNDAQFHRDNNIARQVQSVVDTFFTGGLRRNVLKSIDHYYGVIRQQSAAIADHHEKQEFLKSVYENFYKAYNPKAADRLGIVYTPSEIVKFMIQGTDYLLDKHFNRLLSDVGVKVLDPATGTGTFITELIEHLPKRSLAQKYREDLFCNEVAILPYYIANLNIEYCYQQKMGNYEEFNNICFLDTLDHAGLKEEQKDLFSISVENSERIRRQNAEDLTVIIGNPPYNAWQENFNLRNPNRPYKSIDDRIRDTYGKTGSAQNQIALYDMYTRFLRWAADRIGKAGIVAFVSNSSFIDSKAYDGFRKAVAQEFSEVWIIDTKGNARTSGEQRRKEGGNVFSDQIRVGIAVYFLIKTAEKKKFKIYYHALPDYARASEKSRFFKEYSSSSKEILFGRIDFDVFQPDDNGNWINQTDNDFDQLLPLVDKEVKAGRGDRCVFRLFSAGVKTQRDEWVYDFSRESLEQKVKYMIATYQERLKTGKRIEFLDIKWDRETEKYLDRKISKNYDSNQIVKAIYRPFHKIWLYFDRNFNGMIYQWLNIYCESKNKVLFFNVGNPDFACLGSSQIVDLANLKFGNGGTQCLPIYTYDRDGNRSENITDWALQQFRDHYQSQPTVTRGLSPLLPHDGVPEASDDYPSNDGVSEGIKSLTPLLPNDGKDGDEISCWLVTFATHNSRVSERMVTYKVQRGEPFIFDAVDRILVAEKIVQAAERYSLPICTFNVLPDHVHLIIFANNEKLLNESIRKLKGFVSSEFKKARRLEPGYGIWAQKFHHEQLASEEALHSAIQYVENNAYKHSDRWGQHLIDSWEQGQSPDQPALKTVISTLTRSTVTRGLSPLLPNDGVPEETRGLNPLLPNDGVPEETRGLSPLLQDNEGDRLIQKEDIFHYTYAVLHHPAYRQKYEINLKRDFPRLPLYADFWQWANWGRDLMDWHINYEAIEPYPLDRTDLPPDEKANPPKLKADKTKGTIQIDRLTTLSNIPPIAWDYKLGNRSAIEWVLDQHKEKTPKDPTIRELFNTYRFADYKERAINLIQRVCTVSIKTMEIVQQMPTESVHQPRIS